MLLQKTGSRIRSFDAGDLAAVASLWLKVFRQREDPPPASLMTYFREVFLENPWRDSSLESTVYEDKSGSIVGFLGVLPRPMLFNGRPVLAAITSQFMVDTQAHRGPGAIELMKAFFAGPQELSMTDGATDGVRRIWQALGGELATMYSGIWTRVLRPAGQAADLFKDKAGVSLAGRLAAPLAPALDAVIGRLPHSPYSLQPVSSVAEEATAADLLDCLTRLPDRLSLQPGYDRASLEWILERASESARRGRLHKVLVRNEGGDILGWYLYYARRGGLSKVLQIGGKDQSIGEVIGNLFHHAFRQGSVAVCGRVEPRLARELSQNRCGFTFHDVSVLAHSANAGILNAIHRGAAFLSRLDGEWWLRFHEEDWA